MAADRQDTPLDQDALREIVEGTATATGRMLCASPGST